MQILGDLSNQDDLELILYSMILINTVLNAIPDQDTFYDVSDSFEEQGMQHIIQVYFKNPIKHDENGLFKQIIQQMELYEVSSKFKNKSNRFFFQTLQLNLQNIFILNRIRSNLDPKFI